MADFPEGFYFGSSTAARQDEGYRPTFGMVGIDRAGGLRREVRESARRFGELPRTRSLAVFE